MVALLLLLFFPLLGFVGSILTYKKRTKRAGTFIGIGTSFLALITCLWLLFYVEKEGLNSSFYHWLSLGEIQINFFLETERINLILILILISVWMLLQWRLNKYQKDLRKALAFLNIILFSMVLMLLASDYLLLYIAWQCLGICIYFLLNFLNEKLGFSVFYQRLMNINRIVDLVLFVSVLLVIQQFGTINYQEALNLAGGSNDNYLVIYGLIFMAKGIPFLVFICALIGAVYLILNGENIVNAKMTAPDKKLVMSYQVEREFEGIIFQSFNRCAIFLERINNKKSKWTFQGKMEGELIKLSNQFEKLRNEKISYYFLIIIIGLVLFLMLGMGEIFLVTF